LREQTLTRQIVFTTTNDNEYAIQFRWNGSQIVNIYGGTFNFNGDFVPTYGEMDVMTIVGHDGGGANEAQVYACIQQWLRDMEDPFDGDRGLRAD